MSRPVVYWHYLEYWGENDEVGRWSSRPVTLTGRIRYARKSVSFEVEYLQERFFNLIPPKLVKRWLHDSSLYEEPHEVVVECTSSH
ncbi:MAG: hypothetical protein GWO28_01200 [candidate division Zixibacteria bacterium]|nr:hypothetical protein [candidate division Zixibacteria bacterium]